MIQLLTPRGGGWRESRGRGRKLRGYIGLEKRDRNKGNSSQREEALQENRRSDSEMKPVSRTFHHIGGRRKDDQHFLTDSDDDKMVDFVKGQETQTPCSGL